jgi:subfamily B ATP-binding cassette protein MsbA
VGPVSEVAAVLALCAAIALGRAVFAEAAVSASTVLLTYLLLVFRALPLVQRLSDERSMLATIRGGASSLPELLSRQDKPFLPDGKRLREPLRREIRFEGVHFAYSGRPEVLQGIDFAIPRGSTLALVGPSGAGKTTVALLLARLYDPTAGRISLDGVELRELQARSLRRSIAYVSQETFLFNGSIRLNIAYGCTGASDAAIREAARRAQALEFIEALPQGMETRVGDRGILLSGGQRQRLAIARALLLDADILILDEATSALDSVSERLVQAAIDDARRDRTTLVIAHRLSTLDAVDRIAVLDGGRLVELGAPADLLRQRGYYARLRALQSVEPDAESAPSRLT